MRWGPGVSADAAEGSDAPMLERHLAEIAAWHGRVVDQFARDLERLSAEEREAAVVIAGLIRRQASLAIVRCEQEEGLAAVAEEDLRRRQEAVRAALAADRSLLEERALSGPVKRSNTEGDRMVRVGVVASAFPSGGPPEAVVMVLPIAWDLYLAGAFRPEDVSSFVAYRVVSVVSGLLADLGAGEAPVEYLELDGNLALQVWLGDHPVGGDLRDRVLARIAAAVEGSRVLEDAGIAVVGQWVSPDLIGEGAVG